MLGVYRPTVAATFVVALSFSSFSLAAPKGDPCAKIAGQEFVVPSDALACLKSFPFNETLRQNVMHNVARVFDFYTFEDYYYNSPPPFHESTTDIRGEIARINSTRYATDYDFNHDLYNFINQLNDGHTGWFPNCYLSFQNILPAPVVTIADDHGIPGIFIAPDSVEFLTQLGSNFIAALNAMHFDWKRLAGARILSIAGMDPWAYADLIAKTVSGNYLDHNVRVNSVFSSYRISGTAYSQRLGDISGPLNVENDSLTFALVLPGSTKPEIVTVPFLADFIGTPFTDGPSFWVNNCAANNETNGVDLKTQGSAAHRTLAPHGRPLARAVLMDNTRASGASLPAPFQPSLPLVNASAGVIKSYVLPDKKTGVMFVGSFEGDYVQFQTDVVSAVQGFKKSNVSRLLIDLTNNGGGYVCLGQFLHQYLAGTQIGYAGFQSTMRGTPLAQKIVKNNIALGLTNTFYSPVDWAFLNGTEFPETLNYITPTLPVTINGRSDPTSQRYADFCTPFQVPEIPKTPPFDLKNVAIVSNGDCASTCAMFSTLMNERHNTKIAVFGGNPTQSIQFKGMAGNQVLEWTDLDTEIKTANLKNDPLAPPDLLVNANFRHNWRTAYSWLDQNIPIAYKSEQPKFRFPYTKDTYNNPQNLWVFAATQLFGT